MSQPLVYSTWKMNIFEQTWWWMKSSQSEGDFDLQENFDC